MTIVFVQDAFFQPLTEMMTIGFLHKQNVLNLVRTHAHTHTRTHAHTHTRTHAHTHTRTHAHSHARTHAHTHTHTHTHTRTHTHTHAHAHTHTREETIENRSLQAESTWFGLGKSMCKSKIIQEEYARDNTRDCRWVLRLFQAAARLLSPDNKPTISAWIDEINMREKFVAPPFHVTLERLADGIFDVGPTQKPLHEMEVVRSKHDGSGSADAFAQGPSSI